MKDIFGQKIDKMPGEFFTQITVLVTQAHTVNFFALALGAASLLVVFAWPRVLQMRDIELHELRHPNRFLRLLRAVPGSIIVLVFSTLAVSQLHLPVETIGS